MGWGGRGRSRVDLAWTKRALILSRKPNLPTERFLQKEASLSSMAIEPSMDATNQATEGIKGQNVGNVFGVPRAKEGAGRKRAGGLTQGPIYTNRADRKSTRLNSSHL